MMMMMWSRHLLTVLLFLLPDLGCPLLRQHDLISRLVSSECPGHLSSSGTWLVRCNFIGRHTKSWRWVSLFSFSPHLFLQDFMINVLHASDNKVIPRKRGSFQSPQNTNHPESVSLFISHQEINLDVIFLSIPESLKLKDVSRCFYRTQEKKS